MANAFYTWLRCQIVNREKDRREWGMIRQENKRILYTMKWLAKDLLCKILNDPSKIPLLNTRYCFVIKWTRSGTARYRIFNGLIQLAKQRVHFIIANLSSVGRTRRRKTKSENNKKQTTNSYIQQTRRTYANLIELNCINIVCISQFGFGFCFVPFFAFQYKMLWKSFAEFSFISVFSHLSNEEKTKLNWKQKI